jgi:hypothetical protein
MPTLNDRLTKIESMSLVYGGQRPAGMTDEQFAVYLGAMPERERRGFVQAMSHEDLKAVNAVLVAHEESIKESHHATP